MPEQTDFFLDKVIGGRFHTVQNLGAGGMGTVYKAKDLQKAIDAEYIALKILHPEFMRDSTVLKRTQREAVTMNKLSHKNIAKLYLAANAKVTVEGVKQKIFIMAMEYIPCLDLEDNEVLKSLSIGQRLQFVSSIADALQYVHGRGIVHRDVKPANILVDKNTLEAKLTDFGIIRKAGAKTLTLNFFIGSPPYSPPEQIESHEVDARADIYALCATLYHLVALQPPYQELNYNEILMEKLFPLQFRLNELKSKMQSSKRKDFYRTQIAALDFDANHRPKQLLEIDPYIPAEIVEIVETGMRVDPERRFHSARDLKARIDKYLEGEDSKVKEYKGNYASFVKNVRPKTVLNLCYAMPTQIMQGQMLGMPTPVQRTKTQTPSMVMPAPIMRGPMRRVRTSVHEVLDVVLRRRRNHKPINVVNQCLKSRALKDICMIASAFPAFLLVRFVAINLKKSNNNLHQSIPYQSIPYRSIPYQRFQYQSNAKPSVTAELGAKDNAVTFQHRNMHAFDLLRNLFELKLKAAQQSSYDAGKINELEFHYKALENEYKKINFMAEAKPAILLDYSDAINELKLRHQRNSPYPEPRDFEVRK